VLFLIFRIVSFFVEGFPYKSCSIHCQCTDFIIQYIRKIDAVCEVKRDLMRKMILRLINNLNISTASVFQYAHYQIITGIYVCNYPSFSSTDIFGLSILVRRIEPIYV
jgi:hypothetical protein